VTYFEQAVIGSILLTNGKVLEDLTLTPNDFDDRSHEIIYTAILDIKRDRLPLDVVTLSARLPKLASYLHDCMSATPTPASVNFYASKVIEDATRRRLALAGTIIQNKAQTDDLPAAMDHAKKRLTNSSTAIKQLAQAMSAMNSSLTSMR
jgi:Replicative DNA helicase